jgi:hypothetical protein
LLGRSYQSGSRLKYPVRLRRSAASV